MLNIHTKPLDTARIITGERFDLTDPQRYALLLVRAGRAAAELRDHMDEMSWPQPGAADWAGLVDGGFVRHRFAGRPGDGVHYDLFPKGLAAAQAVIRDLCCKFNVHVMTNFNGGRGLAPHAECSCGRWRHAVPNNSSALSRLGLAFGAHLRDPEGAQAQAAMDSALAAIDRFKREAGHA